MIYQLLCCSVGLWLLAAAWAKVRRFDTFIQIVRTYPLPGWLRPSVGYAIPVVEALLAFALLSPWPALAARGLVATLILLCPMSGAVALRLARGERRFRCGCGGDLTREHSAIFVLARNILVGAAVPAALLILRPGFEASVQLPLYLAGAAVVLGLRLADAAVVGWRSALEWKAAG